MVVEKVLMAMEKIVEKAVRETEAIMAKMCRRGERERET
jgi:hypothetical protein